MPDRAAPQEAIAAGSSHKLPPLRHITYASKAVSPRANAAPVQRTMDSPAAGPASHDAARYNARPPSRGRTGRRLKAHKIKFAPAKTDHRPPPAAVRLNAQSRFAPGPARTAASSFPYDSRTLSVSSTAPIALSRRPDICAPQAVSTR